MPLDLDTLKARWGVTGTGQDALVAQVAAQAQALAETYTGRRFDLGEDSGDFEPVAYSFQVPRFPIVSISALHGYATGQLPADPAPGAPITAYRIDKAKGLIWPGCGGQVHCTWTGGYETWPPDLEWAVTQAADIIWSDTPGGGAAAGSGGGAALGAIKKLSVVGVYSAEIGGADSSGGGTESAWGVLPAEVTAVLDRYMLAAVVGIG